MDDLKRIKNETCKFINQPCIEDQCENWKATHGMTLAEYQLKSKPKYVTETRWCDRYKRSIPMRYGAA